ncbi:DUF721 domain-containing protein [Ascidiimonas sp. W6]|uniref:DUF721 domain-containing protein n=1 Tax=Ascidiimonas meishanensis TaxID=3128903 RepID=UPI0030ED23E5
MAKRINNNLSMADALKEFISENHLEKGMDKIEVQNAWKQLMGNGVNNYTTEVRLQNTTLYVQLSSAVLREELSYGKEKIIKLINEEIGKEVIKKLVLR